MANCITSGSKQSFENRVCVVNHNIYFQSLGGSDAELSHHGIIKCLYELLEKYTKTIEFSYYLTKKQKGLPFVSHIPLFSLNDYFQGIKGKSSTHIIDLNF